MSTALTVALHGDGSYLIVEMGQGQWISKVAAGLAGVTGVFLFPLLPLLATTGYGIREQRRLVDRTMEVIKEFLPEDAPKPSSPTPAQPFQAVSFQIRETNRTIEDYFSEPMVLDNLRGNSALTRVVTINKEWSKSYVIGNQEADKAAKQRSISIGGNLGGKIASDAERTLSTQYSVTQGMKQSYTDQITLEVPPHTKRQVLFLYRRIWQHGIITYYDRQNKSIDMPFRVAVSLTLDLAQQDEE
jgi:hypothetical protein